MQAILSYFWQICLLRVGPEKIPSSIMLTQTVCVIYVIVLVVATMITRADLSASEMFTKVFLSFVMEITILFSLLSFKKMRHRFLPTLSALFGCNTIMLLLTLPVNGLQLNLDEGSLLDFFNIFYVACLFWWFAIAGFIYYKSANISLFQGIVVAISMELLVAYSTSEIIQLMSPV